MKACAWSVAVTGGTGLPLPSVKTAPFSPTPVPVAVTWSACVAPGVLGAGAVAVQVSQDPAPLLFVATDKSHVLILDAQTGKLQHDEKNLGQTPQLMLNP